MRWSLTKAVILAVVVERIVLS